MVNSFVSLVFIKLPMDYSEEAYQHPNQIKMEIEEVNEKILSISSQCCHITFLK